MNEEEVNASEIKKKSLARKKVQDEMDQLRKQIRELRQKEAAGQSVVQDIEACVGYLKVLKKELHSIKEGSHTTFLSAKKLISPKFNYGSKKEELLFQIKSLAKEIREAEKKLTGAGYSTEERQDILNLLEESKSKHHNAMLELKAIEQYNHTRFLEQKAVQEVTSTDVKPSPKMKDAQKPILKKKGDPKESPVVEQGGDKPINFDPPPMI